jgi:ATP-dependent Clp protease ATP-binding subunit ClpC
MSTSIELVMQVAGQEAVAGRFDEFRPEHLLLALLKLAEIPILELGGLAPGAEVIQQVAAEVQVVRRELATRGIDSTQARRRLRAELGRGACENVPRPMHRSEATRKIFDEAAKLAHAERSPVITVLHLLIALLANPTTAMVKVLGGGAFQKGAGQGKSPLLDRYGKDLTLLAKEGKLQDVQGREADTKALLWFLASTGRSAALLITDLHEVARDVVIAAAAAISGGKAEAGLKDYRILDISDTCQPDTPGGLANLQAMLEEAAASSNIVLFVPAVDAHAERKPNERVNLLRAGIEKRRAKIICRASAEAYSALLAPDTAWRRLTQPIWLRERVDDTMPQEL